MAQHFTIVNQVHDWSYDTNGNRYGQWTITFQTPSGVASQVIVPDESYQPAVIAGLIASQVEAIEGVQALTFGEPADHRPAQHGHTH